MCPGVVYSLGGEEHTQHKYLAGNDPVQASNSSVPKTYVTKNVKHPSDGEQSQKHFQVLNDLNLKIQEESKIQNGFQSAYSITCA